MESGKVAEGEESYRKTKENACMVGDEGSQCEPNANPGDSEKIDQKEARDGETERNCGIVVGSTTGPSDVEPSLLGTRVVARPKREIQGDNRPRRERRARSVSIDKPAGKRAKGEKNKSS